MYRLQQVATDLTAFAGDHIVCVGAGGACSWEQFQQRISAWAGVFSAYSDRRIALYHKNTMEFAAALLALWRLQKIPVLPATPRVDTGLRQCCRLFAGCFENTDNIEPASPSGNPVQDGVSGVTTDEPDIALVVFTSGSTGTPLAIEKRFCQLDAELATWESMLGATLGDSIVTATVSHQHIYGLLFRVLWPLCAGRAFTDRAREYWEELFRDSRQHPGLTLITSPAHLDRMPPEEQAQDEWRQLAACCRAVFSSGSPLSAESAERAGRRLEKDIVEIFGSSETGGIAWRHQSEGPSWRCLPGVEVRAEQGLLQIRSPHLPSADWFGSADCCELFDDNTFLLLGRSDNLVKLGGKRISLQAIENRLVEHPWVERCRVISLQQKKDRLAAIVCLSKEGNQALVDTDKTFVNEQLKRHLEGVERIALPRYWRYLSDLPRDSQGKVTRAGLEELFSPEAVKFARVIQCDQNGRESAEIELFIPMNLYYFQGHFPGTPVLPGIVQSHWAIHYGRELFSIDLSFSHMEVLKFQQVIRPQTTVTLKLEYKAEKNKLLFSYSSNGGQHSSGRIAFAAQQLR